MNAEHILDALGDVHDRFVSEAEVPARPRRGPRWLGAAAAALLLAFALAIPAAAYTDTGHRILYALSPDLAQALKPVNESCEKNGVRMAVREAAVDGETAWFRIALTDTTGALFHGPIDLCDSYSTDRGFDAVGTCRQESYDEAAHTATFLVRLNTIDGSAIDPGKVTFRVRELWGRKEIWNGTAKDVDLTEADPDPETLSPADLAAGYDCAGYFADSTFLVPGEGVKICPGAAVTGLGWVDGKLRVQVRQSVGADLSATGTVWLTDGSGQPLYGSRYGCFFDKAHETRCDEYVFNLTPEKAGGYMLRGRFSILADPVQGPWEVTFPLE